MNNSACSNVFALTTPVLFVVFNRPETTRRVFEAIREAHPPRLFVAADGARPERAGESETAEQVRQIATAVDWPCELKTRFSEKNQGCRIAVSSAVDWFFSQVEEGIILEDDCVPSLDFFRFCQEMLEYYRDDDRIMSISGSNMQLGRHPVESSYYFSRYVHIWGWASWRRAWKHYDVDMKDLPSFLEENVLASLFPTRIEQRRWREILWKTYHHSPHFTTWDFQWGYTLMKRHALAVTPTCNLITNIGCTATALHTAGNEYADIPHEPLRFPLVHPEFMYPHREADHFTFIHDFANPLLKRLANRLRRTFAG